MYGPECAGGKIPPLNSVNSLREWGGDVRREGSRWLNYGMQAFF